MQLTNPSRRRVSRETRLLLAIVLGSLAVLWVLARLRFPGRPVNPVPPVLAQLAPESAFDDMASTLAQLQPRLSPWLLALGGAPTDAARRPPVTALRIGPDVAIALVDDGRLADGGATGLGASIIGRDAPSRLAVIRVPAAVPPEFTLWSPRRPADPRFLVAAVPATEGVSLRPVFVGTLHLVTTPLWRDQLWAMPPLTDVTSGTFVFALDGSLAGAVAPYGNRYAIVPAETLFAAANRLLEGAAPRTPGDIGLTVAPLASDVASASGARAGMVVVWVDPQGPAAGQLVATDVIERVNDLAIATPEDWRGAAARIGAGDAVVLGVRRSGEVQTIRLIAAAPPVSRDSRPLGLTMRTVRRIGVEVIEVEPGSAAAAAGIEAGDLITRVGTIDAPSAASVHKLFGAAEGKPLLVALTRDRAHHVVAIRTR